VVQLKKTLEVNLAGGVKEVSFNKGMGIFATFTYNEEFPKNRVIYKEKNN
jgi:hypothetical protein